MKRYARQRKLELELLESRCLLAANVLVVWEAPPTVANQPDEAALYAALTAAGNTVDTDSGAFITAPPTAAQLADVDVILVARTNTSGDYTNGSGETVAWNALTKPMLVMSPHLARSSHWGLIGSTSITNDQTAPTTYNAFPNPTNPFVTGLTTAFANSPGVFLDNLISTATPAGSTTVATITVGGQTSAAIVDIPAGASSTASGGGTFGGRRVYFTTPDYPDRASQNYNDVLTANANTIVMRIIDQLANRLEAENATLSGPIVDTLNAGFFGTGYADYGTTPGQYIQWNVTAPVAGLYTLGFRYANGVAANRPLELSVNGVVDQAALTFNPTGAWTTWGTVTEQVALNAGANTVRLTMTGTDGPNIDGLNFTYFGPNITPPSAAPTDLTATAVSSSQVNLFWSDNANNETEYQVERKLASGGSYVKIATLPANATAYSNTGLTASTQYLYRVRASNSGGDSAYTNEANATTLPLSSTTPSVTSVNPAPGATDVFLDKDIVATVFVPNGGVNSATMSPSTVKIYPTGNPGAQVAAVLNTSGGGDIIVARPVTNLAANTSYTFEVTVGLQDVTGVGFTPFTSTFTTGTQTSPVDNSIQFEHVALANVPTGQYPAVTIGPDGKFYASGVTGDIFRWDILADGTLGPRTTLTSFRTYNGGQNRLPLGIKFDPASTANNLILWVTSSAFAFSNSPDWTGKLTRLAGPNLENVQDAIINLPRSFQDHATNQIDFGPDGKLYFLQGSMTAMGAQDSAWGNRDEHMLSAAMLRFDPALWNSANGPIDVKTEAGGTYDPFAPGAPLTIYADGIRNAYDLVWHSNGQLYVPTNGSAAGGNTPGTPAIPPEGLLPRIDSATNGPYTGPAVPQELNLSTQHDWLFRVVQGGYYGHPNPLRNEYVLNGGNPTNASDPAQVNEYPVGTLPDRNYRGFAFDFGLNRSADGVIEYHYGGFGGALVGKLVVARFSSGDDLIVLEPGLNGDIVSSNDAIASFDGFNDPLDLVENPVNGYIYVTQYDRAGGQGTITLLRPQEAKLTSSVNQLIFDEVRGGAASAAKTISVFNTGTGNLTLSNISITGTDASLFAFSPALTAPQTIAPGGSLNIGIVFNPVTTPVATALGPHMANLHLATNDSNNPTVDYYLGGLATAGEEGNFEPAWQLILNTFRIPINVGDPDTTTAPIEGIVLPNANNIPRFVKAGPGAVTIEMLASFVGDSGNQTAGFVGWYDSPAMLHELFQLGTGDNGQHQELNPTIMSGSPSFDPGAADFGLYSGSPTFPGRISYSENALNTWDGGKQKQEVFPLKDINGNIVPNAYLVGTEEATNNDFQDYSYIIRNVMATTGDFNEDAHVDGTDFLAWQRGLGTASGATRAGGDANFDGAVTVGDLGIWKQQFGLATSAVAVAADAGLAAIMAPSLLENGVEGNPSAAADSLGLSGAPATNLADLAFGGAIGRTSARSVAPRPHYRPSFIGGSAELRHATVDAPWSASLRHEDDADANSVGEVRDQAFESLGCGDDAMSGLRNSTLL